MRTAPAEEPGAVRMEYHRVSRPNNRQELFRGPALEQTNAGGIMERKRMVVEVNSLSKRYGQIEAVKNVSFSIPERCIFGLLGPNGAGKTSIIEMIEGIRTGDAGTIRVSGLDPIKDGRKIREIIGAQLQTTALHDKIRIREVFHLFAGFYRSPKKERDILEWIGLVDKENFYYQSLSGGEKQRVALGLALIGDPQVVFLDEPTTGLDAEMRLQMHKLILQIRDEGKVVLMSTHYIQEAENLCDLVGVLQAGTLKAIAPPQEMIRMKKIDERVRVAFFQEVDSTNLQGLNGVSRVERENGRFVLSGPDAGRIAASVTSYAEAQANKITDMKIFQASLEDAYLQLTGMEDK
jgi:ABC-2 type transport system ATP-binding protein